MQTFLPSTSFKECARVLDYRRLGKQRVEAKMILNILVNKKDVGWANYPAVRMWQGYEETLAAYYNCCVQEWIKRGYKNTLMRWYIAPGTKLIYPKWFGGKIHTNHRTALLYKAARRYMHEHKRDELDWYDKFEWTETAYPFKEDLDADLSFQHYYWPVR